ncbi:MAG: IS630 family transposase [Dehalococcoidales bacterium]|nr:IS630 family transposase [Dehalococcoidales bacterium]
MSRKAAPIVLTTVEKKALTNLAKSRTAPYRKVQRARLVLLAAEGMANTAIAQEVGLQRSRVIQWRQRFTDERVTGLEDRPRPGKPRQYSDADRLRVIETACTSKPEAETHWSVRTLAKATGVGRDTVHQILRQADLKPHQVGTFTQSPDPDFAAKVVDVVGLYLHPPENTVVLCVDEKTQVQALDRTQPMLPMRPHQIERHTHDYKRNGTVQLYAALEVQAGHVIPRIEERHRSREFIAFMNDLLRAYPSGELHIILDNVKSHDSKEVREWHKRPSNKRAVFHFIPTYSSWMNLAEVLFNLLQAKVLRRGAFPSKRALVSAIMGYIEKFNKERRVFHWTKTADTIISSSNNLTGH